MPLSQVQPGMQCTGYSVVQGTTISSFNVQVLDIANARDVPKFAKALLWFFHHRPDLAALVSRDCLVGAALPGQTSGAMAREAADP